jgi:hypothetical protein
LTKGNSAKKKKLYLQKVSVSREGRKRTCCKEPERNSQGGFAGKGTARKVRKLRLRKEQTVRFGKRTSKLKERISQSGRKETNVLQRT